MNLAVEVVESAYRPSEDGIRRWRDLDIAEWLGLQQIRDIRAVIERNREELERHGGLRFETANPSDKGGRPGTEYWLTFEQAMVICTLSRTPRAEDVRTIMIQVFGKVARGEIAKAPRMENHKLERFAAEIVAPILEHQKNAKGLLVNIGLDVKRIHKHLITNKRRAIKASDKHVAICVLCQFHDGYCPSCRQVRIAQDNQPIAGCVFDHYFGPNNNALEQMWPICAECNREFESDAGLRSVRHERFHVFQENVTTYKWRHWHQPFLPFLK